MIELIEAPSGQQQIINKKLFVYCDCDYTDPCPNGKKMGSNRCIVRLDTSRLKNKELKRLLSVTR